MGNSASSGVLADQIDQFFGSIRQLEPTADIDNELTGGDNIIMKANSHCNNMAELDILLFC